MLLDPPLAVMIAAEEKLEVFYLKSKLGVSGADELAIEGHV